LAQIFFSDYVATVGHLNNENDLVKQSPKETGIPVSIHDLTDGLAEKTPVQTLLTGRLTA
jgi:hypothetical protein